MLARRRALRRRASIELDGTQGAGARMIVQHHRLRPRHACAIGDRVEIVLEHVSDDMSVPRFRPVVGVTRHERDADDLEAIDDAAGGLLHPDGPRRRRRVGRPLHRRRAVLRLRAQLRRARRPARSWPRDVAAAACTSAGSRCSRARGDEATAQQNFIFVDAGRAQAAHRLLRRRARAYARRMAVPHPPVHVPLGDGTLGTALRGAATRLGRCVHVSGPATAILHRPFTQNSPRSSAVHPALRHHRRRCLEKELPWK